MHPKYKGLFQKYGAILLKEESSVQSRKDPAIREREVFLRLNKQDDKKCKKSISKEHDKILNKKIKKLLQLRQGGSVYSCDVCAKKSAKFTCITHRAFEDHMKSNHPECKPFKCNICPEMFKTHLTLVYHIKKYHYKLLLNL
jgi:hypothetical protein